LYQGFPKRSINAKDVLLILLAWIAEKIFDFVLNKTNMRVRRLKLRPLRLQDIGNWCFRLLCRMLGVKYVDSIAEFKRLMGAISNHQLDEKVIFVWMDSNLRPITSIPRCMIRMPLFIRSKDALWLLGHRTS